MAFVRVFGALKSMCIFIVVGKSAHIIYKPTQPQATTDEHRNLRYDKHLTSIRNEFFFVRVL